MLKFLYDFIPVLLFFFTFRFYGIYAATVVGIIATAIQVLLTWVLQKQADKQQLLTLVVFVVFGGMTLYFHNPIFVKLKPTVVFWLMGLAFFISHFFGKMPLVQRMMESGLKNSQMTTKTWRTLNMVWTGFFLFLGAINFIVAFRFGTNAWVNFKLYGISGLLLVFCLLQAAWLARYMKESDD